MGTERRVENFRVVGEILSEMDRQFEVWGVQDHKDGRLGREYDQRLREARELNDLREEKGAKTWDGILLEEVFEALATRNDPVHLRTELLQIAAVCASWASSIDRRGTGK